MKAAFLDPDTDSEDFDWPDDFDRDADDGETGDDDSGEELYVCVQSC